MKINFIIKLMEIIHKTNLTKYLPDILFQISVIVLAYKMLYTACTGTGLYMIENCVRRDWEKILVIVFIALLLNITVRIYFKQPK